MKAILQTLLLLYCLQLSAQLNFSDRSTYGYPACILTNIECRENDCYVTGVVAVPESNFYPVKTFSQKINQYNTLIDSSVNLAENNKDYWSFNGYNNLALDSHNKMGVTGYTYSFDTFGLMGILFSITDFKNQTQQFREFYDSAGNQYASGRGILSKNNSWYILATVQDTFYNGQILLLQTDSLGNLLWKKHYGIPYYRDEPGSMIFLSENRLLIGYARNNLSTWAGVATLQTNWHLLLLDSAGTKLGEWQDYSDSTLMPRSLIKTQDGGYAFVTNQKRYTNGADVFTQPAIVKLDSNFNLQWKKYYGPTDFVTNLYKLVELSDRTLIAAGTIWASNGSNINTAGWFLKLDANGDSLWSQTYSKVQSSYSENIIYDFDILNDGSLIGVGLSIDHAAQTQGQQGWIIRVDSMGCLIPGCDTLTTTAIKENAQDLIGVKIYPNPASNVLIFDYHTMGSITSVSITILDIIGKKIIEQTMANQMGQAVVDINLLPDGLYSYSISSNSFSKFGKFTVIH